MPTKVVNLSDFAEEIGAFSKEHLAKLHDATVEGIARSIPMLVEDSPVDTGLYAQSWTFEKTETGAILGNTAPHAAVIEYGMRSGYWVPIAPLLAWAKRVLGDPSQPPEYSKEVRGLAYAVQRKIHDQGQQPKHVLEKAMPAILENIRKSYADADRKS